MIPADESRNSQLFECVWQNVSTKIDTVSEDAADRRFLESVVMGGTVAAESAVSDCRSIREFWGEGNHTAATELSQLFSLVMLGQIHRWAKEKPPENMPAVVQPEISATRVVYIFGGEPEQGADDFTHFDKQFLCDLEKHPHLIHFGSLLLARTSEICGHKCINWSKVKFPVIEMTHLVRGAFIDGAPIRNKPDIDAMLNSVNTGVQAMMSYYVGV